MSFDFSHSHARGLHFYHHASWRNHILDRHWPPERWEEWPSEGPTPLTEYGVEGPDQTVAVYLGLAWRITAGRARYGVPVYARDEASNILKQQPDLIDWEYKVAPSRTEHRSLHGGFVQACSSVPTEAATSWRLDHANKAGLFEVDTFHYLAGLTWAVSFDPLGEVNLYANADVPQGRDNLLISLRGANPPKLADLLDRSGIFIDIVVDTDPGTDHSMTICSRADLGPRLAELQKDYERRVACYEEVVDGLPDMEAFLGALEKLSGWGAEI